MKRQRKERTICPRPASGGKPIIVSPGPSPSLHVLHHTSNATHYLLVPAAPLQPVPITEKSTPVKSKEKYTLPIKERSTPAIIKERSTSAIIKERFTPAIIKERSTPAIIKERTTPVTIKERSTPAIIKERSTPVTIKERSTPVSTEERSTPVKIEESTLPIKSKEEDDDGTLFKPVRFKSDSTREFLETLIEPQILQHLKNGMCKIAYFTEVYKRLKEKEFPVAALTDRTGGDKMYQRWRNLKHRFLKKTAHIMRENELGGKVRFGVLKYPHYNYILIKKVLNILERKSDLTPKILQRRRKASSNKIMNNDYLEIKLPNNKILLLSSMQPEESSNAEEDHVKDYYSTPNTDSVNIKNEDHASTDETRHFTKDVKNEIEEMDPLALTDEFHIESDVELSDDDMDQEYNEILEELECDMGVEEDEKLLEKLECVICVDEDLDENDHKIEDVGYDHNIDGNESNDHNIDENESNDHNIDGNESNDHNIDGNESNDDNIDENESNDHNIDLNESNDHNVEELPTSNDLNIDVNVSNDHKYGQSKELSHFKLPDENILKFDEKFSRIHLAPNTVFDGNDLELRFRVQENTEEDTHMVYFNLQGRTDKETPRPATQVNTSASGRVITPIGGTELSTTSNRTKVNTSILEKELTNCETKLTTPIGKNKVTPSGESQVNNTPSGETQVNSSICETELYSYLTNCKFSDTAPTKGHKVVTPTSETKVANPTEGNKVTTTNCGTKSPVNSSCCAYAHALIANMNALAEQNLAMSRNMTDSMKNFFEMQKAFLEDQRDERRKTNQLLELVIKMVAEK